MKISTWPFLRSSSNHSRLRCPRPPSRDTHSLSSSSVRCFLAGGSPSPPSSPSVSPAAVAAAAIVFLRCSLRCECGQQNTQPTTHAHTTYTRVRSKIAQAKTHDTTDTDTRTHTDKHIKTTTTHYTQTHYTHLLLAILLARLTLLHQFLTFRQLFLLVFRQHRRRRITCLDLPCHRIASIGLRLCLYRLLFHLGMLHGCV